MAKPITIESVISAGGGPVNLADLLKITSQAVSQWERVPTGLVLNVERITGIPRHKLRPDIYPADEAAT